MSKLLSYFLVENKESNIVFQKSISSNNKSSTSIHFQPPQQLSSSASEITTNNKTSQKSSSSSSQKLQNKRQLKLTQLLFNKSDQIQQFSTITSQSSTNNNNNNFNMNYNNNNNKINNNNNNNKKNNIIEYIKNQQIPLQQTEMKKQEKIKSSQNICSFSFEFKDRVSDDDNGYKQQQPIQRNQKQQKISLLQSYSSPSNYDAKTSVSNISNDSPVSLSFTNILTNKSISKDQIISSQKRKNEQVISEFELSFKKKRSIEESNPNEQQQSLQLFSLTQINNNEQQQAKKRTTKKQLSFLSQFSQEDYEIQEESNENNSNSNNDLFSNMQDLFTCTETLSPCASNNDLQLTQSQTQSSQTITLQPTKSKASLKNKLKMIDSFQKKEEIKTNKTITQNKQEQLIQFKQNQELSNLDQGLNYKQEYLQNIINLDQEYALLEYNQVNYNNNHNSNNDNQIDGKMRCVVINWIYELCQDYYLSRQTCQNAINIFDRYVSFKSSSINKSNIQLIAATCVSISAKKEEQICPKLKSFIESTKNQFTAEQFRQQEIEILTVLKFKINSVSLEEWLYIICKRWDEYIDESKQNKNKQNPNEENTIISINQTDNEQEELDEQSKVYFTKENNNECRMRYNKLEQLIDLMQLHPQFNQHSKKIIILALIYVTYGIYSADFLLDDVINYFNQINIFYHKDYFAQYNSFMKSFRDLLFCNSDNSHSQELFSEELFIQAISFVSQFYTYFQIPAFLMNRTERQKGKQYVLENGLQFILNKISNEQQK